MKAIKLRKQRGVAYIEYALLGALVAVVVTTSLFSLGDELSNTFFSIIFTLNPAGG